MLGSVLRGMSLFRWVAWIVMAVLVGLSEGSLGRPWLAWGLIGLALVVTAVSSAPLRRRAAAAVEVPPAWLVGVELACGYALLACDGLAYRQGHAFASGGSLGVAWPMAGVLVTGLVWGPAAGLAAGVVMGSGRTVAVVLNGVSLGAVGGSRGLSLAVSAVLYAMAGGVAGYVAGLLRRAEREISAARAREEVARTLHDGVLQTLAVVERRAEDPELAALARRQERELRRFLLELPSAGEQAEPARAAAGRWVGRDRLAAELLEAAGRLEEGFGVTARVVVAEDVPKLPVESARALVGAVGEALFNVGKHAAAGSATVYCEPAEEAGRQVFCSVKDDGTGFDPAAVPAGIGLARSVRGRIEEAGGRVEVASRPGSGTEVRLWL